MTRRNQPLVHGVDYNPYEVFGNAMTMDQRRAAMDFLVDSITSPDMTQSEFIFTRIIADRTIRYGKYFECIRYRQMLNGPRSLENDGRRHGYPISRKSLSNAATSLQAKGLIFRLRHRSYADWPDFYGINYFYGEPDNSLARDMFVALTQAASGGLRLDRTSVDLSDKYMAMLNSHLDAWLEAHERPRD